MVTFDRVSGPRAEAESSNRERRPEAYDTGTGPQNLVLLLSARCIWHVLSSDAYDPKISSLPYYLHVLRIKFSSCLVHSIPGPVIIVYVFIDIVPRIRLALRGK